MRTQKFVFLFFMTYMFATPLAWGSSSNDKDAKMMIHYVEIVTEELTKLVEFYKQVHGLTFGSEEQDLGLAYVARKSEDSLIGIRAPLASHDKPITRTYYAVDDINDAIEKATEAGAIVAYPPTQQGDWGTFAIVILGDTQHGFWQK